MFFKSADIYWNKRNILVLIKGEGKAIPVTGREGP
jgi:hypothetical protein